MSSRMKNNTIHPTREPVITLQPSLTLMEKQISNNLEYPHNTIISDKYSVEEEYRGLEALMDTEHLFVRQSTVPPEVFTNTSANSFTKYSNQYEILNSEGGRIFFAVETTDLLEKTFCGGAQPFDLKVFNRPGNEIYMKEILNINGVPGYCGCGAEIHANLGKKNLGKILQDSDCFTTRSRFLVIDDEGKELLKIYGPDDMANCFKFWTCSMTNNSVSKNKHSSMELEIFTAVSEKFIGRIAKYWAEEESKGKVSNYDIWGIRFDLDLNVQTKALLLAALFLMDFQFFEKQSSNVSASNKQ